MKKNFIKSFALILLLTGIVHADVTVREIKYDGKLSDNEARFVADLDIEVAGKGEQTLPVFDGEVAVLTSKLPAGLRLVRAGNRFNLIVEKAGTVPVQVGVGGEDRPAGALEQSFVCGTGGGHWVGGGAGGGDRRGCAVVERDGTGVGNEGWRHAGARGSWGRSERWRCGGRARRRR